MSPARRFPVSFVSLLFPYVFVCLRVLFFALLFACGEDRAANVGYFELDNPAISRRDKTLARILISNWALMIRKPVGFEVIVDERKTLKLLLVERQYDSLVHRCQHWLLARKFGIEVGRIFFVILQVTHKYYYYVNQLVRY